MRLATLCRTVRAHRNLGTMGPLQYRCFQPDFTPRDPNSQPPKYKYPAFYEPYGARPPPSEKIVQLSEKFASLSSEEREQIWIALEQSLIDHPKLQHIEGEGVDLGTQGGAAAGSAKPEEAKAEKTTFNIKLEKFDAASKLKVIKEIRSFTDLGLKEAKDLVEKVPAILKQQVTKDEATAIIEKIKAVGGVAVME